MIFTKAVRRAGFLALLGKLPPCLVGMEACATAHHWVREVEKLGHTVRLIPPAYVKPYVRRQKNYAADAAAICEAVTRPTMRFVPVKTVDQQSILVLHRERAQMVGQRTALINATRAHLAEFGFAFPGGAAGFLPLRQFLNGDRKDEIPSFARAALKSLCDALDGLDRTIEQLEKQIAHWHQQSEVSKRLATIPGVGVIVATALAASVSDVGMFRSGREFSAYLGLTPRQSSSGGKERLGRISKMGDGYLRSLSKWSASHWPTRSPESPGRCLPAKRSI